VHQELPTQFEKEFDIPKEETIYTLESTGYVLEAIATAAIAGSVGKVASSALANSKRILTKLDLPSMKPRLNYSSDYLASAREFTRVKEFKGVLKKDLVLVRYHDEGAIVKKSWKWWTSTKVANQIDTLSKIKEHLALLDSFGKKTHVTVARIPKGTSIQLLQGRAKSQFCDGTTPEFCAGGGYQIRLKKFDECWIKKTCSLDSPGVCIVPSKAQGNVFNHRPILPALSFYRFGAQSVVDPDDLTRVSPAIAEMEHLTYFVKNILQDAVTFDPTHPEQSTANATINLGGVTAGLQASPFSASNSAAVANMAIGTNGALGGTFVPVHPKQSTVNATTNLGSVTAGLQANPINPKASQISVGVPIKGVGFAVQIPLREPLKTKFSVQVPISNTPFTVGVEAQLSHLEKLRFKVEMPLGVANRITKYVGIQLGSVPIASVKVVTVFKHPKKIFHKISRWHKKKKHRDRDYSYLLRPLTLEEMTKIFFSQINQSDKELLVSCLDLMKELYEFEKGSQVRNAIATQVASSMAILQDIATQFEKSLAGLEKETALLQQQVEEIKKGPSLAAAADNLKNLNQTLSAQTAQLSQNKEAAVQVLKTKITPQMAALALSKLKK
jgi:hypothetical protein